MRIPRLELRPFVVPVLLAAALACVVACNPAGTAGATGATGPSGATTTTSATNTNGMSTTGVEGQPGATGTLDVAAMSGTTGIVATTGGTIGASGPTTTDVAGATSPAPVAGTTNDPWVAAATAQAADFTNAAVDAATKLAGTSPVEQCVLSGSVMPTVSVKTDAATSDVVLPYDCTLRDTDGTSRIQSTTVEVRVTRDASGGYRVARK